MAESRSALIVATSEYEDARLTPLGGPGQDAEALDAVLRSADIGGFDVQLALNAPHDELRTTLEGFFADRGRDDLLLVHFSGHGLKDDDGQLYLAAADTKIDRLMSTGIEAGWVNRLMTRCRSEKIALFLDCCFGGAFTAGLARRAGVDMAGANETFGGTGRFVITASDAMQYSFESGQLVDDATPQPSPFTSALVEGLRTGEADRNEDGFVSINELFDYLEDRVRQLSPSQTPTKSAFNQVGDWVIAQSTRAPTIRILPASIQAHLKSDQALERMGAVIDLRDLIEASDPRLAEAARKALEKLTGDDSKAVAAAALRVFGDMPSPWPPDRSKVVSTPLSEADVPQAIKDALTTEPSADVVRAAEVATGSTTAPGPPAVAPPPPSTPASSPPAPTPPQTLSSGVLSSQVLSPQVLGSPAARPYETSPAALPPAPAVATPAAAEATGMAVAPPTVRPQAQPRPGALWGEPASRPAPAPAKPTSASGAASPWTMWRAFGRAGLGTFLGLLMATVYYALAYASYWAFEEDFVYSALFGVLAGGIFSIVEKVVPPLRIPDGAAYRVLGNNRWVVSGLIGAILAGVFFVLIRQDDIIFVALGAAGFLAAEAIVGGRASATQAARA